MADEIANLGKAIRTYLRSSAVLASAPYLGSNAKIYLGFPRDKDNQLTVPTFSDMIVIMTGRGGRGDIGLGFQEERVDIMCYGTTETKCKSIWRAMENYFLPIDADVRRKTYFRVENCQVSMVAREGGPLTLTDPDAANWPYTMAPYIFTYRSLSLA